MNRAQKASWFDIVVLLVGVSLVLVPMGSLAIVFMCLCASTPRESGGLVTGCIRFGVGWMLASAFAFGMLGWTNEALQESIPAPTGNDTENANRSVPQKDWH